MYEHAIPQNIMEYEFKLFAGLSLKQFIYVAVSVGFAFGLYQLVRLGAFPAFFGWILIPLIVLVGVGLGLGSFGKRSMEEWINSFTRVLNTPLRRVWKKDTKAVSAKEFFATKPQVFPSYLAGYFMNPDEYRKLMQKSYIPSMIHAQDIPTMPQTIDITSGTYADYAEPDVTLPAVPNTIAFRIQEDKLPVEGVVAYLKDANNNVVTALMSNKDGILYFSQSYASGDYYLDLQSDDYTFPKIHILFDGRTYPLLNITPLAQ